MTIDELTEQFKSEDELKIFAQQQFKQILQLSNKIKNLEEKNKELSDKAKQVNNLASISPTSGTPNLLVKDDAKTIAQVQLKMLKDVAFERELTLEEAKKVEIFNKISNIVEEKPKTFKADAKSLGSDALLTLLEGSSGTESK